MASELPTIIDSHVHLYAATHLSRLNWTAELPSDHILNRQNSVEQYRKATGNAHNVRGFVFVEADRKFGLDEAGWVDPLEEVAFLARIIQGQPIEGEGHQPTDSKLLLGIVAWAPIPAGPDALATYVSKVRGVCKDDKTFPVVKGFRYLLQNKPKGTMLDSAFIAGLKWFADNKFSFDLGVDLRQGGIHQLQEACELFTRVFNHLTPLTVVINHFCKPNFHLAASKATEHPDFVTWSKCIKTFASYPSTYMKLSGFFAELPPQEEATPTSIPELIERIKPWVDVLFAAFGPNRIMFGSDWPVCSVEGPGLKSWTHWVTLVSAILDDQKLDSNEKQWIWSGTAAEAYRIN